jgi:hypothetical protein
VGAICDPAAFTGIVEVPLGVLGPRDGSVFIDLVEPGREPLTWYGPIVLSRVFRDFVPWVVFRVFKGGLELTLRSRNRLRERAPPPSGPW